MRHLGMALYWLGSIVAFPGNFLAGVGLGIADYCEPAGAAPSDSPPLTGGR